MFDKFNVDKHDPAERQAFGLGAHGEEARPPAQSLMPNVIFSQETKIRPRAMHM
jgi:hypothetical protein